VWASWRPRLMWITLPIGIFLPLSQIPAITATANHYFLDAAAGTVVALLGFPAALALRRWAYPPLIGVLERSPWPALRGWLPADTGEVKPEAGVSGGWGGGGLGGPANSSGGTSAGGSGWRRPPP
jgi:uncharacterized membrane protein YgcG